MRRVSSVALMWLAAACGGDISEGMEPLGDGGAATSDGSESAGSGKSESKGDGGGETGTSITVGEQQGTAEAGGAVVGGAAGAGSEGGAGGGTGVGGASAGHGGSANGGLDTLSSDAAVSPACAPSPHANVVVSTQQELDAISGVTPPRDGWLRIAVVQSSAHVSDGARGCSLFANASAHATRSREPRGVGAARNSR